MSADCNGHCICNIHPEAIAHHFAFSSPDAYADFIANANHYADTHCDTHRDARCVTFTYPDANPDLTGIRVEKWD